MKSIIEKEDSIVQMKVTSNELSCFGKAYDLLNIPFIILDQSLLIDFLNDTAKNLLKLKAKTHPINFIQHCHELEITPFVNEQGLISHEKPVLIDNVFLLWRSIPVMVDSEKKFFLTCQDVTQSERRFQAVEKTCEQLLSLTFTERYEPEYYINEVYKYFNGIINKIPCYVYWKNTDMQYIGCNQMAAEFINVHSAKEIIGKTDFDIFNDWDSAKEYRTTDEQIFATGIPVFNQPGELVDVNGKLIHTLVSKIPIYNQAGIIMGLAGISVDVTDLKNAQVASEKANQIKTEFIANMSHDIRTPLTGVVGIAKLLEDNAQDNQQKLYSRWLGESSKQLLHMLNSILDVISVERGSEVDVHAESFSLPRLIDDIVQLERPSTLIKGLDFDTYIDEEIPLCLIGDATKIHRIILNLVGNAIKFTEKGRVEINISLVEKQDTQVVVQFCIIDTGIGIPDELQDNVFDRFYRINPSNKGIYSGHGVGLHIVQSYVSLLGGNISLKSKIGQGTELYFTLTLKIGDEVQKSDSTHAEDKLNTLTNSSTLMETKTQPKLLLVEDNKIALFTLESLLGQAQWPFVSVMDGEAALQLIEEQSFDLIITDLGLPGISGIDLTKSIRTQEKEKQKDPVPIIGLTAHSEESIKLKCQLAGMNAVFTKPMTIDILSQLKAQYFMLSTKANTPETEAELVPLDAFALFDAAKALEGMGNDLALLKKILNTLLAKDLPTDLEELKKAHTENDWQTVERLAHRMKSGFLYCGVPRLVKASVNLESCYKAGHMHLLEPLYQQLLLVIEETKQRIKQWLTAN